MKTLDFYYSKIKENTLWQFLLIFLTLIFVSQGMNYIFTGQSISGYVLDNFSTPYLKYIIFVLFIFSAFFWLIYKKKKNDNIVLIIISIYYLLQTINLSKLNFSWFPIDDFLFSDQIQIVIYSFWIVWPWQEIIYNFCEKYNKYLPIVFYLIFFSFFALLFFQLGYKYYNFNVPTFDDGLFKQAIDFLSQLQLPRATVRNDLNLWADHFHPILIPIALIYKIFKSGYTLAFIQAIALSSTLWPLYKLAKKFNYPVIVVIALLLFLPFQGGIAHANEFGFHPELISVSFLVWLVWALFCNQKYLYLFLFLSIAGKENMGFYAVSILTTIAIFEKSLRSKVIWPIIISIIWSLTSMYFVIPYFLGEKYRYFMYDQLGSSIFEVVSTLITNPIYALTILFEPIEKLYTMLNAISTPNIFYFLGPYSLLTIPFIFETMLSSRSVYHIFGFHYQVPLAIATLIAISLNINWIKQKLKTTNTFLTACACAMLFSLIILLDHNNIIGCYIRDIFTINTNERNQIAQLINKIDFDKKNTIIVAQDTLVAPFSDYYWLYQYPNNRENADILLFAVNRSAFPVARRDLINEVKGYIDNPNYQIYFSNSEGIIFCKIEYCKKINSSNTKVDQGLLSNMKILEAKFNNNNNN